MGLMVSTLRNMPYADRNLFIYLLDYGWPEGPYEKLFKDNFQGLARRASDTYSVVIASDRGVHFANEVFSWHQILGHDASEILPAILITDAHPNYFNQEGDDKKKDLHIERMALIPLRNVCTTPDAFLQVVGSIFEDLANGLNLKQFRAAKFDVLGPEKTQSRMAEITSRVINAFILQPNFAGIGVDIKKLFEPSAANKDDK